MLKRLLFYAIACGISSVYGDAISIAPGGMRTVNANLVAGAGAVCPGTQFGTAGQSFDGTVPCSNLTLVGGANIMSANQTTAIGNSILRAFPGVRGAYQNQQGGILGTTGLQVGQNFSYNRKTTNNKPAAALDQSASSMTPVGSTAFANAVMNAGMGTATSKLTPKKQANGLPDPIKGVAVAYVSDPATFEAEGPGASVDPTIGSAGSLLSLEADDPGDVAAALYELAIGSHILFSMTVSIDFATSSLANVQFDFSDFDPAALGYGSMSEEEYVQDVLLPDLVFNSTTHTLSETAPISVSAAPFLLTGQETFSWNFAAIAGDGEVPEPGTLWLGAPLAGLLIVSRLKRSARRGPQGG